MTFLAQPRKVLALILLLAVARLLGSGSGVRPVDEYQMKALFLCNFAEFVVWPERSPLNSSNQSMTICVIGDDPFGRWLDEDVKGRSIDGRKLTVRRISKINDARSCPVLFIPSSEEERLPALMSRIRSTGTLTIGESDAARVAGVVITFTMEGRKVRFRINGEAAETEKLRISSKLLSLARDVK